MFIHPCILVSFMHSFLYSDFARAFLLAYVFAFILIFCIYLCIPFCAHHSLLHSLFAHTHGSWVFGVGRPLTTALSPLSTAPSDKYYACHDSHADFSVSSASSQF